MYKSKLQELCFENSWALPQYTAIKTGPDHIPLFRASVFIGGKFFHSPTPCGSLKETQNQAAKTAFAHFTSPDSTHVSEGHHLGSLESFGESQVAEGDDAKLTVGFSSLSIQKSKQACRACGNCLQELEKIDAGKLTHAAASVKSERKWEIASDAQADTSGIMLHDLCPQEFWFPFELNIVPE